jgi:hypothetical protein
VSLCCCRQPFDISDVADSTVEILDFCDQVIIENPIPELFFLYVDLSVDLSVVLSVDLSVVLCLR